MQKSSAPPSLQELMIGMDLRAAQRKPLKDLLAGLLRRRLLTLLEEQAQLERMARIVGRESLPASQQLTLLCAELVNEGILRQSSFSLVDRYCSPKRQTAMLLAVMDFIQLAEKAVQAGASPAEIAKLPLLRRLHRLGEEFGEDQIKRLELLRRQLEYEVESLAGSSNRES